MKTPNDAEPSRSRRPKNVPEDIWNPPPQPERAGVSCQIRLTCRHTGRWSLTADETSMRVIAAMIRNSSINPRYTDDPVTKAVARRVLRAIKIAGCF
jgi:hypothetical protein